MGGQDAPDGKGPGELLPLAAVGREHQLFPGCMGAEAMGLATPPHPLSSLGVLTRWGRGLGLALSGEMESRGSPKEAPFPALVQFPFTTCPLRCSCLIDIATPPPPPCPWPTPSAP